MDVDVDVSVNVGVYADVGVYVFVYELTAGLAFPLAYASLQRHCFSLRLPDAPVV